MKPMVLALSTLLVAGLSSAAPTAPVKAAAPTVAVAKTHMLDAEIVSSDATAKTLTIKGTPDNKTLKVATSASSHLAGLKAGEKVKLTVHDETVTHITIEKLAGS